MADETPDSLVTVKDEPFKKPVLIGRIGKLPKKAKSEPVDIEVKSKVKTEEIIPETTEPSEPKKSSKSTLEREPSKESSAPIAYKEPKWSGLCPEEIERTAKRVSPSQWDLALDFLERNPSMIRGYNNSARGRQLSQRLWRQLTLQLNAGGGAVKSFKAWATYFNNHKSKIKKTVSEINAEVSNGGPALTEALTDTDLRFVALMGPGFGQGNTNVVQAEHPAAAVVKVEVEESDMSEDTIIDNTGIQSPQNTSGMYEQASQFISPPLNGTADPIPRRTRRIRYRGSGYALEVLKSGSIVERVDLTKQPYYVFGRLPNCDVVMAHPTISRHHCVLQYKAHSAPDSPPPGWYLLDLGSTHGTHLNRERLRPAHYTRVRVHHQIKFGNSTRTYILVGPDFDCEGESELTVTEIKQKAEEMKAERDRMIREAKEKREKEKIEEEKRRAEQGIDWGMGEDADDETDLSENPFAVPSNEELYLADPKKTLRGFFEREGYELHYDCQERGQGQYICKVELPIDDARGRAVVVEAAHAGKKKDAVLAAALEACRELDRAGLLRQAKHESRRRKERDWSADDFYDSDDDNYLDRTGQVENKRRGRMQKHGALKNEPEVLTYDQLLKQVADLQSKIAAEEKTLERLRASIKTNKQTDEQTDDLDQYIASLSAPTMSVKAEISTSKMTLQKLKGELSKAQRLAELARPAHLPPLVKKDDVKLKVTNSVVYGKRIKLKTDGEKKPAPKQKKQEEEFKEEVDSDEEESRTKESLVASRSEDNVELSEEKKKCSIENKNTSNLSKTEEETPKLEKKEKSKKIYGPMRPPDDYVIPEDYFNQESDRDLPEIMEAE